MLQARPFLPGSENRAPNGALAAWTYGSAVADVRVTATQTGTYTVVVATHDSRFDATGDYVVSLARTLP